MGREIHILWAGRHRRDEWDGLCRRYRKRIEHTLPVRERAVRVKAGGDRRRSEADRGERAAA